jgi:hypothetical protein
MHYNALGIGESIVACDYGFRHAHLAYWSVALSHGMQRVTPLVGS